MVAASGALSAISCKVLSVTSHAMLGFSKQVLSVTSHANAVRFVLSFL